MQHPFQIHANEQQKLLTHNQKKAIRKFMKCEVIPVGKSEPQIGEVFQSENSGNIYIRISATNGKKLLPHGGDDSVYGVNIANGEIHYVTSITPIVALEPAEVSHGVLRFKPKQ